MSPRNDSIWGEITKEGFSGASRILSAEKGKKSLGRGCREAGKSVQVHDAMSWNHHVWLDNRKPKHGLGRD